MVPIPSVPVEGLNWSLVEETWAVLAIPDVTERIPTYQFEFVVMLSNTVNPPSLAP